MSGQEPSRDEAIRSLKTRAEALEQRNVRPTQDYGGGAVNQAYRILAELIAGVAVGLVLGLLVDRFIAGVKPWGTIGGVLMGFAVSVWMARRTANRLMALAAKEGPPPQAVPFDDEED